MTDENTEETTNKLNETLFQIAKYGLAVIVLILFVGMMLSDTVKVERQVVVKQDKATVFAVLNGFGRFNDWSPWADIDPNAKYTYDGPWVGEGSTMCWQSDDKNVGNGCQTITKVTGDTRIDTALDFGAQGQGTAYYEVGQDTDGTLVTWGFETDFGWNLIGRYFGLFMDGMIGKDYEKGLQNFKKMAESMPPLDFSTENLTVVTAQPMKIIYVEGQTSVNDAAIKAAFTRAYGQVVGFMRKNGIQPTGAPLSIATKWEPENNIYAYQAGMPFDGIAPELTGNLKIKETHSGPAAKALHIGPYADMVDTYERLMKYIEFQGFVVAGDPMEVYVNDPAKVSQDELMTEIYFPVARAVADEPAAAETDGADAETQE